MMYSRESHAVFRHQFFRRPIRMRNTKELIRVCMVLLTRVLVQ